ncbi:adenylate kinase family enzyme [Streptomyces sp. Ag109_O5-1]|uniref:nucleoside monophosphate kinase n=1 Tax=Streptomyces sp. Ag109_O5-1 TaxID=1938851 RepID=UPI000F4FBC83|nr:nucleoside monophosphate kinase [Streptomyces sp. Ag109_O5-1]RPE40978.1 adenylate kinase family enzyme [Streptomyces sp. Ag109_O5-1]
MSKSAARQKTVIFILGAPGAGKSTTSQLLADRHGFQAFQSGQVLREAAKNTQDPQLRELIASRMERSIPMPVEVYCRLLEAYVPKETGVGLVFDGYPRTVEQAMHIPTVLDSVNMSGDRVVGFILDAPQEILIARSAARFVCGTCGQNTREDAGCCDSPLLRRRPDDSIVPLLERSKRFRETLPSVREIFSSRWPCFDIDASSPQGEIVASIRERLQLVSEGGREV